LLGDLQEERKQVAAAVKVELRPSDPERLRLSLRLKRGRTAGSRREGRRWRTTSPPRSRTSPRSPG